MKNAKVLEDHLGDDGHVTVGKILLNVPQKRFEALEKKGLIREATTAEVTAGDDHGFVPESERNEGAEKFDLDVLEGSAFHKLMTELDESNARIVVLTDDLEARNLSIEQLTADVGDREVTIAGLNDELTKLREDHGKELEEARTAMDEANKRAAAAEDALGVATDASAKPDVEGAEKQKAATANKKAADPANKGA